MSNLPAIIQGGMGVGVSSWRLARAVSAIGQLGVVSGTALDQVFARRLQDGDPGGHMRRGLDRFPFPAMAERIWRTYYIAGGKRESASYRALPMHAKENTRELKELCIVANFVEVTLARGGATKIRSASTIWKRSRFRTCLRFTAPCSLVFTTYLWAPVYP